jgi:hypothetical protein
MICRSGARLTVIQWKAGIIIIVSFSLQRKVRSLMVTLSSQERQRVYGLVQQNTPAIETMGEKQ